MVSLKTKFKGGPLDRGAQPMLGWLTTLPDCCCTLHTYIWHHITSRQPEPIVAVALREINMRNATMLFEVQYSSRFDTTTAT